TVIMRHALRNALLPLASVVPVDIITMIGGAVITETIFGWNGMGKLFIDSMRQAELDPVMAYILITGLIAIIANLVADFLYAVLDPRIRVNARVPTTTIRTLSLSTKRGTMRSSRGRPTASRRARTSYAGSSDTKQRGRPT